MPAVDGDDTEDALDLASAGEYASRLFDSSRELVEAFDEAVAAARGALAGIRTSGSWERRGSC